MTRDYHRPWPCVPLSWKARHRVCKYFNKYILPTRSLLVEFFFLFSYFRFGQRREKERCSSRFRFDTKTKTLGRKIIADRVSFSSWTASAFSPPSSRSLFSLIRSNPTEHLSPRNETSRGITVFAVVLAIPAPHFPPIDKLNYPPSSVTCTYVYK